MRKLALAALAVAVLGGLSTAATSYTIYQLQTPPGHSGEEIETTGIVTGVIYNGFWIEDESGGFYSGVWVFTNSDPRSVAPTITPGDTVTVVGTMEEYYGNTEVNASSGTVTVVAEGTSADVPTPDVVTVGQVTLGGTEEEEWEHVLVKILGVTVINPDAGHGEYTISDDGGTTTMYVDDKFYTAYTTYFQNASPGDYMDSITGIMDFYEDPDERRIQPRSDGDLEGEELPPEPDEIPIYSIQTGLVTGGERVKVYGVCTTGTGDVDEGFFLQDPNNFGGSEANNGIWVYDWQGDAAVTAGDTLKIIGTYTEYYDESQIEFEMRSDDVVTPVAMPSPVAFATNDFNNPVTMEPYEGVRVSVSDALVLDDEGAFGLWVIDDGSGSCEVANDANNDYRPTNGDYVSLVGPVRNSYDEYKICPGGNANVSAEFRLIFTTAGWKMMSVPLRVPTPIADCLFDDGVERKLFADASSSSWVQDPVYYYTNTYKSLRPAGGDDDAIRGEYGYWMLLYQPNLTFIIPLF